MNRRKRRRLKIVSGLVLGAYLMTGFAPAQAHNNQTHQDIVNQAWQAMRIANRSDLRHKIVWSNPASPPASVSDLDTPGDCALAASDPNNLCGQTVSVAQWQQYLGDIQKARQELNGVSTELPAVDTSSNASCRGYAPAVTVGDFARPVSVQHLGDIDLFTNFDPFGIIKTPRTCDFRGPARNGIFANFTVPDDRAGNQGLVLGWHAQHRDDDQADTEVDITSPILAQVLEVAATVYELILTAVFLPFVCLWSLLFSGDNCVDESKRLADDVDPIDYLKGILPGWRNQDASENGRTLWHFINVQPGLSNEYDDHQGMLYDEGGPLGWTSGTDQAIILAADLAFLTLDASNSAGTERYEITSDETDFPNPSSDRGDIRWQMESFAHTAMSPLDNFAFYGDQGRPDGHPGSATRGQPSQMGWPLHAIGDASVPFHVVGTTGWGHRTYEDAVQHDWPILLFQKCRAGDPCDPSLPQVDPDFLKVSQLKQARRILQRGFRWVQYLRSHPDIRDFITQVASDTAALSLSTPPGTPLSVWCDACSAGWGAQHRSAFESFFINLYSDTSDKEAVADPEGYYHGTTPSFQTASGKQTYKDLIFNPMRTLLEQAMGATVGYLVFRAGASPNCSGIGGQCGSRGANCCSGTCGSGSTCCRNGGDACYSNADCCSGSCVNEVCTAGLGESCGGSTSCSQGQCLNGACCQTSAVQCRRNADCCSGTCTQGLCVPASCNTVGCPSGKSCVNNKCCGSGGATCALGGECCSGFCGNSRQCLLDAQASCQSDSQCAAGICVQNLCCRINGGTCSTDADCCSASCVSGACVGKSAGAACSGFAQCSSSGCASTCVIIN